MVFESGFPADGAKRRERVELHTADGASSPYMRANSRHAVQAPASQNDSPVSLRPPPSGHSTRAEQHAPPAFHRAAGWGAIRYDHSSERVPGGTAPGAGFIWPSRNLQCGHRTPHFAARVTDRAARWNTALINTAQQYQSVNRNDMDSSNRRLSTSTQNCVGLGSHRDIYTVGKG